MMRQSRQSRKWTPDERGMLALLWQTVMPVSEIASILDRTETSMQQQASLMRINRPHKRPHRKKDWTREEDAFLIKARAEGKQYVDIHMEGRNASQMKNRIGHLRRKGAIIGSRNRSNSIPADWIKAQMSDLADAMVQAVVEGVDPYEVCLGRKPE